MTQMTETFDQRMARLDRYEKRLVDATKSLWEVLDDPELGTHEPLLTSLQGALEWLEILSTCGDCVEGRCHWGGESSRESIAAAEAGREYRYPGVGLCGCEKHEFSVQVRQRRARLKASSVAVVAEQTEPAPPETCTSLYLHKGKLIACGATTVPHERHQPRWPKGDDEVAWMDSAAVPSPWPKDQEPPAGIDLLKDTLATAHARAFLGRVRDGGWMWARKGKDRTAASNASSGRPWPDMVTLAEGDLVVVRP